MIEQNPGGPSRTEGDSTGISVAGWGGRPSWAVYAALLLTSAALLTLEISLTRFFSHTIWYHFAYLTISVALLGFGATGSIIAAFPAMLARVGQRFLVGTLVLAAVVTVAGLSFLAQFPLEIENITNKPLEFSLSLLVYYIVVAAPFLLAGFTVSVPFAAYPHMMGRLYFWDLVGAALGCAAVVSFIELLGVPGLVFAAAGLMLLSAAALALSGGSRSGGAALAAIGVVVVALSGPAGERLPIAVTSSKSLPSQMELVARDKPFDQRTDVFTKWTAINRVDAFGWDYPSPLAMWVGLGLREPWKGTPPQVARLMYDAGNGSDLYGSSGDIAREFEFLEHHLLRTPYVLLDKPSVLVIGVGGGIDMFNAIKQGARHVTGAELQPETVKLLRDRVREFTDGFYLRDDVTLVPSEGRHFVRKTDQTFDLVQISFVDTFAAQAAGAYVLAESYLYTVEAMEDYLRRLSPDGIATTVMGEIVFEGQAPPLTTRLAMIGYRALERQGVANPSRHILVVGSVTKGSFAQNASVMVKKSPFTPQEIERISAFARESGFSILYAPGVAGSGLTTLLGDDEAARQAAMDAELFNVEATYDGDPFFYNVGKWKNFSPGNSILFIMPGSFMGQLVLVLMVLQSTLLGAVLVITPLLLGARQKSGTGTGFPAQSGLAKSEAGTDFPEGALGSSRSLAHGSGSGPDFPELGPDPLENLYLSPISRRGVWAYLAYFLALGLGFMFVEISFVQSFVLFLGSPTYALSVTIFALLLFSGIGSLMSSRFAARPEAALTRLAPLVAALIIAYAFGLSHVFDAALHLELAPRIAIAVLAQMPIGLTLGMFMPLGIACVAREQPRLVPWAWGVNGVGSVAGTTLAVLLAMALGFRSVSLIAAALYLIGTALLVRAARSRPGSERGA